MLVELVGGLGFWRWIILGVVLLGVELIAPGTVMLWLGLAALAVGIIAFLVDPGWQAEILAFAILGLAAAVAWWLIGRRFATSDQPMLHRRAERHIGRSFTLDQPIVNGEGRIRIDDTTWRVRGPDLAAGVRVKVARAEGALLVVEADG